MCPVGWISEFLLLGEALSRLMVAILENFQQEDGSIKIPQVLEKYFNKKYIK